ncbi:MAG: PQQ-binding-like beta-propeller repeat protein [Robiginitomaculum sp.]
MSQFFKLKSKRLASWGLLLAVAVLISGCSTVSKIIKGNKKSEVEKITSDPNRISILSLNDQLKVAGTILPSEIVLPESYVNPDWAQTGGYATHSPQRTDASGQLSRLWSRSIGKKSGRHGHVIASPVVSGGVIFAVDGGNKITAMDSETGKKIWDFKVEVKNKGKSRKGKVSFIDKIKNPLSLGTKGGSDKEAVGGGIAVADGRVYVTSGFGVILALDAVNGSEIWRYRSRTPMHSAPAVDGGRLFAVSDDNELFAVDADTGEILWTYQAIVETARMLTSPSPAVLGDVVVAPFSSGEIVALRVQNGGVLWQDALSATGNLTPLATLNDIASGPVIVDGYVFAAAQSGTLSAFDMRTGQRVWSQPAGSINFPLVLGDFVYTVTTEGEVSCMSKADGTVIWITQVEAFKNVKKRKKRISWSGPVSAGDRLVLMSSNGKGIEMNPYDGTIIREFKLGGSVYIAPIVANNTVYYLTDDAKLVALR